MRVRTKVTVLERVVLLGALFTALAPSQTLRDLIRERIEEKQAEQHDPKGVPIPRPTGSCEALNVGFRIQTFSMGLRAGVWYPATDAESVFRYANGHTNTALASDAPVADCEFFPLIVFSHGFGGCGTQSIFLMEALARAGYIVVAPDHKDARCKVDKAQRTGGLIERGEEPFRQPAKWSAATYKDRGDDIRRVLDELAKDTQMGPHIDWSRVGACGHSLGGYTIMGLAGGWSSWRDDRIKAALLLSPYVAPFLTKGTLGSVRIPVMYQGGTRDFGITPTLKKKGGAYDSSNAPKFFEELEAAGHFDWTNKICFPYGSVQACNLESPMARTIDEYGIAFFDHYLKGKNEPILDRSNTELAEYRYDER
jgi:predicted dienelactone hydrolase